MLKSVLYHLLLLTTFARFGDLIYILAKDTTNLPIPVIVVTSAMVLYGLALVFYKFIGTIRMKQLVAFYTVQSGMIVFNLAYVAAFCPLQVSFAETLIVGTFLDLLINAGLLYFSMKRMRSFPIPVGISERSLNV